MATRNITVFGIHAICFILPSFSSFKEPALGSKIRPGKQIKSINAFILNIIQLKFYTKIYFFKKIGKISKKAQATRRVLNESCPVGAQLLASTVQELVSRLVQRWSYLLASSCWNGNAGLSWAESILFWFAMIACLTWELVYVWM